jgi:predicted ATPase
MKRYILTGTPGSGKTILIRALSAAGHLTVPEAATDVIAQENRLGNPEPWRRPLFVDEIVKMQRQRQLDSSEDDCTVQFHDRSPVCTYALCSFLSFEPSAVLLKEMARIKRTAVFEKRVFFIENLGFVEPTEARRISFADALVFEKVHRETYERFGFELTSIPALPIPERIQLILAAVKP